MDIQEVDSPSKLKGAAKVFAKRQLESSWQIKGVPGFITMTHRDKCLLCKQYAKHTVAVLEKPMIEILSHWIELAFRTAWPRVVERIRTMLWTNLMASYHGIATDTKTRLKTRNSTGATRL